MRRQYFYTIRRSGELVHDGTVQPDPAFLDFFFRRLHNNPAWDESVLSPETSGGQIRSRGRALTDPSDYPFVSLCAGEENFVYCEDVPVVYRALREGHLHYAGSLCVPFQPDELWLSATGQLYHPAPIGALGRLANRLLTELSASIVCEGNGYVLKRDGQLNVICSGPVGPGSQMAAVQIKSYSPHLAAAVASLFTLSVQAIDERYYTAAQKVAWAPDPPDVNYWDTRLARSLPFLAYCDRRLAGFMELETDGHIDCFYVHPDFQGCGVGSALLHLAQSRARPGSGRLYLEASLVARQFFEERGFVTLHENRVIRGGQSLVNFSMEKIL
ncbi:MAG: GNAT family N-acetyltransferase [Spirochaetales bacterium]|nr:GNAT family N-acetyltransferase [Spirochaetales bacterium]